MAVLLEVKNLETQFFTQDGIVKAVDGISYDILEGERGKSIFAESDFLLLNHHILGSEVFELFFILGLDAMEHFSKWKEPETLLELCQWAIVERPGHQGFNQGEFLAKYPSSEGKVTLISMPLIGISGMDIRRRVTAGMSLRYYLPEGVAEYIRQHKLYRVDGGSGDAGEIGTVPNKLDRLLELALERGALKYGKFALSSGKERTYYFDGRLLSLDPEGAQLIAEALLPILVEAGAEAVGGLT